MCKFLVSRGRKFFQFPQIGSGIPRTGGPGQHLQPWIVVGSIEMVLWKKNGPKQLDWSCLATSTRFLKPPGCSSLVPLQQPMASAGNPKIHLPGSVNPAETWATPETVHDISLAQDQAR
jgi:hypothetical protein